MAIKHETVSADGTVIYCDDCRRRGPQIVGDDAQGVTGEAERLGWETGDEGDRCPKCKLEAARQA